MFELKDDVQEIYPIPEKGTLEIVKGKWRKRKIRGRIWVQVNEKSKKAMAEAIDKKSDESMAEKED